MHAHIVLRPGAKKQLVVTPGAKRQLPATCGDSDFRLITQACTGNVFHKCVPYQIDGR